MHVNGATAHTHATNYFLKKNGYQKFEEVNVLAVIKSVDSHLNYTSLFAFCHRFAEWSACAHVLVSGCMCANMATLSTYILLRPNICPIPSTYFGFRYI